MTHSEKMLLALEQEDLAQAQIELNEALRKDQSEILMELGEVLFSMGFLEETKSIYETLIKRLPENEADFLLPLAEIAIENDDIEAAFAYLEKIQPNSENYPSALLITADIYQVLGIPEVSEAKLKEAEKILPEEPLITFALAELYFSNQQWSKAHEQYQKLLALKMEEVAGVALVERIGNLLSMQGDFEASIPYLEAAVEKKETPDNLFQLAFVQLQLKENEKAIEALDKIRQLDPQYQAVYLYLAEALQAEERLEEAQAVIEEGLKENPYQVDFYHFASENSYRLHDSKKAEQYLIDALQTGEKEDETLLILSNLYLSEELYEEAIEAVEAMENTDQPYALWNLAQAYYQLEEFEQAAKFYAEASFSLQDEADFLKEYGLFLREEGRLREASEYLVNYLNLEPGDLEVLSILEDLQER
ncbi:tetratricopeptide repeat protein [Enterococcus lemanii]|uniref:Tetratricopeptide repeat protein n=1 Tax=Enterococcus lemanii TaxID=1159752 RepID=A0ABV9MSV1_9ENTE|nr:tetratricopeptide repeat protein [Enterococcus lemanii]MBM7709376.1 tetratricopeptide (TPR) repeat protein [Enterococcus lemanii]